MEKNLRILVVDDSKTIRMMIRESLNNLGFFNVAEAEDGDEAFTFLIENFFENPIELILCDFEMPKLDGRGLLKALKHDNEFSKIPFIMISGKGDLKQIIKMAKEGLKHFIVKPFDDETLMTKLEGALIK